MSPDQLPPEFAIPAAIILSLAYLVIERRAQRRENRS